MASRIAVREARAFAEVEGGAACCALELIGEIAIAALDGCGDVAKVANELDGHFVGDEHGAFSCGFCDEDLPQRRPEG